MMKKSLLAAIALAALLSGPSAASEGRSPIPGEALSYETTGGVAATAVKGPSTGPRCLKHQVRRCVTVGTDVVCICGSFFQLTPS